MKRYFKIFVKIIKINNNNYDPNKKGRIFFTNYLRLVASRPNGFGGGDGGVGNGDDNP